MRLRWFQTYDKNGVDSEKTLQYWDKDVEKWKDVLFVRRKKAEEEESLNDETDYYDYY